MKKNLLLLILLFACFVATAQTTPGPVEKEITDKICNCLTKLDLTKVTTKEQANAAYMNCVMENVDLFPGLAEERKVDMTDQTAMRQAGISIGVNLLKQKCAAFITLSALLAENVRTGNTATLQATSTTTGTFKHIDLKGFNYIVITDDTRSEKSFLWLRQFPGSESFMNGSLKLTGKKLKISWHETEAYLPQAKGYYNVKEIVSIDIL